MGDGESRSYKNKLDGVRDRDRGSYARKEEMREGGRQEGRGEGREV